MIFGSFLFMSRLLSIKDGVIGYIPDAPHYIKKV